MSNLRLVSAAYSNYSWENPSGTLSFQGDGTTFSITITEEEARRFEALARDIFLGRQASIANQVASLSFPVLAAPEAVDAEFTEVPSVPATEDSADDYSL